MGFRNSIRSKLMSVVLLTCGSVLFTAVSLAFLGAAMLPLAGLKQGQEILAQLGSILTPDPAELTSRLYAPLTVSAGILAVALLAGYAVSSKLLDLVSAPLFHLLDQMRQISREQDYTIRATRASDDELGELTTGVNEMLDQIELRDGMLLRHRDELKERIAARARELVKSKEAAEATSRIGVEGDLERAPSAGTECHLDQPVPQEELMNRSAAMTGKTAETAACEPQSKPATSSCGSSPRILLVDDNPINLEVSTAMLGCLGYQVTTAQNGRLALEELGRDRYDLMLLDCQMPEMDGYQVASHIREREAAPTGGDAPAHLPIVALTAHALEADRDRCLRAGMDDYLSKPCSKKMLQAAVGRWLPGGTSPTGLSQRSAASATLESSGHGN